jgi:hypothetical protein
MNQPKVYHLRQVLVGLPAIAERQRSAASSASTTRKRIGQFFRGRQTKSRGRYVRLFAPALLASLESFDFLLQSGNLSFR